MRLLRQCVCVYGWVPVPWHQFDHPFTHVHALQANNPLALRVDAKLQQLVDLAAEMEGRRRLIPTEALQIVRCATWVVVGGVGGRGGGVQARVVAPSFFTCLQAWKLVRQRACSMRFVPFMQGRVCCTRAGRGLLRSPEQCALCWLAGIKLASFMRPITTMRETLAAGGLRQQ